jgi:DNA-directed RNA polymerase specialized sigma24 family protein
VPAESRRVLELRYADGLGCAEVAAAVGVGLDAIYKRLSRLHATLRQCVEGKLIEPKGGNR